MNARANVANIAWKHARANRQCRAASGGDVCENIHYRKLFFGDSLGRASAQNIRVSSDGNRASHRGAGDDESAKIKK